MWLNQLSKRWLGLSATRRETRAQAARRPGLRLIAEQLEDRLVPSTFNAATVSDLIADINAANKAGGSNTIVLAANTTFDLTEVNNTTNGANGLPVIANSLAITGQGADIIQRDGAAPAFRLLDVAGGASLTLQNLTLQSGLAFGSGVSAEGGGIFNQGTLVLNEVTVQGNAAVGSAGVSGNTTTSGNSAAGGGIYSSGTLSTLTLEGGTVVQNNKAAGGNGGDGTYDGGHGGDAGNGFGGGLYLGGATANPLKVAPSSRATRPSGAEVALGGAPAAAATGPAEGCT